MRIAILTSGILPVPAVQGGAVENLIDFYLEYNDRHRLHDITVYSVWHPDVGKQQATKSDVNHYKYINVSGWLAKIQKKIYQKNHGQEYYHYSIEFFLHQALKDIQREQYDVIILENRPGYALKLQNIANVKLVYHLHNDILNNEVPQFQPIYDGADRIITVSDYIRTRVKTICQHDTKTITVLNGINLDSYISSPHHLKETNKSFSIVFSGRLIPEKGILPLILAMQKLKNYPNISLVIIGSSSLGNNKGQTPFLQQLHQSAHNLNNIHFTGYIDYVEMAHYLQEADVAVLPSTWEEPFGLTCAEALAAGLPIITTRRGGIPEVVDDTCAILLEFDDYFVDHLADAILDLYEHPEKRKQMAKASLERAKLFDKETYARNFFNALV